MLHFTVTRFIVAFLVSASTFIRIYTGIDLGIDEAVATMLVGGFATMLAFIIPSWRRKSGSSSSSAPSAPNSSDRSPCDKD